MTDSLAIWGPARALLDRALESPKGITINFPERGKALSIRQHCYTARSRDRKATRKAYPSEDPRHGRSAWDALVITMPFEKTQDDGTPGWAISILHDSEALSMFTIEEVA